MLTMPTWAFFRSSSVKPIPYNIACAAGCVGSCVIVFEYLFSSFILCYQLLYYYLSFVVSLTCTFCNSIQQIKPRRHGVTVLHSDLFVFLCAFVSLWFKKIFLHKFHISHLYFS